MATPGWYPDPAGRPGAFRFWDGQTWGSDTTDNPYAAAPGSAPAPAVPPAPANPFDTPSYQSYAAYPGQQQPSQHPGQYPAQPGWGVQTAAGAPAAPAGPRSTARTLGIVALAVVMTVLVGVITFFVARALLDDGSAAAIDTCSSASCRPAVQD
ncbi:DUF2510 domain-containing protein [Nocardioides rubriscoriae]|uniref:DUF2510 domain-containing protein n=1 Tax=Nocardioides rubriscoriae TaxID=642762 RepID=UPI0011DFF683|nr:DUF2510 domain-containing protein [Nocardioides rubriscoriae]